MLVEMLKTALEKDAPMGAGDSGGSISGSRGTKATPTPAFAGDFILRGNGFGDSAERESPVRIAEIYGLCRNFIVSGVGSYQ